MLEKSIFKKCIFKFDKLADYGFIFNDDIYTYEKKILNDSFSIIITITFMGCVTGKVYDLDFEELYTNYRIEDNIGEFAGKIRNEFISLLEDIKLKCSIEENFVSNQANRISNLIKEKYNDEPYFEWDSTPDAGVFKNKDTKKWYALIMNINRNKLDDGSDKVDIINLKIDDKKIPSLLKIKGIYPAYHMNKKYWISVILDNSLDDNYIMKLIDESYSYTVGVRKSNTEWIIPVNPKYYDISLAFKQSDIITFKQSSNIKVGDIVYIYVAFPISSIMYKCSVLENNIPYSYRDSNLSMKYVMKIKLIDSYYKDLYNLKKLNKYGVTSIRGPRFMPKNLSDYINK